MTSRTDPPQAAPLAHELAATCALKSDSRTSVCRFASGDEGLPVDLFLHVFEWAGSADLGALAAVSRACRQLVVMHLRETCTITLDICTNMFAHGEAALDALRGCAIRGIRLAATHLAAVQRILTRDDDTIHLPRDEKAPGDHAHIKWAATVMISRNAATLQEVDLDESAWGECKLIVAALVECRHLTTLDSDGFSLEGFPTALLMIVASNLNRLTRFTVGDMTSDTLTLVLRRMPLTHLRVFVENDVDPVLLARCTTLERLRIDDHRTGDEDDDRLGDRLASTYDAFAYAAPRLTRLRELRVSTFEGPNPKRLPWHFAPSVVRLIVSYGDDKSFPEVSGGSVALLDLDECEAPLVARLIASCRVTMRELRVANVRKKPARFFAALPVLLAQCPLLASIDIDGFARARTLLALVRACPALAVLRTEVHSSFRTMHLAAILVETQGRLRELRLGYSAAGEKAILATEGKWTILDAIPDEIGALLFGGEDADEFEALARLPLLHLPHLASLDVHMCVDALLMKMRCPKLTRLRLLGARVRLQNLLPQPSAFPQLETLGVRVCSPSILPTVDSHLHITTLTLSWEGSSCPRRARGRLHNGERAFRPEVLHHILERCPATAKLTFEDHTPAANLLEALVFPRRLEQAPSRLFEIAIPTELRPSSSVSLVHTVQRLPVRHPHLRRVDVARSVDLDRRIHEALSHF